MNISTASSPGKSRKSRLPAFFRIEDRNFVLFDDDGGEPAWETDINVGNGATSKNGVCRPVFECWNFDLNFFKKCRKDVFQFFIFRLAFCWFF